MYLFFKPLFLLFLVFFVQACDPHLMQGIAQGLSGQTAPSRTYSPPVYTPPAPKVQTYCKNGRVMTQYGCRYR